MPPKKPAVSKPAPKAPSKQVGAKGQPAKVASTQKPGKEEAKPKAAEAAPEKEPEEKVLLKQLSNFLFNDDGKKIRDSGRWPWLIDEGEQAATFLRYRDTNYINALDRDLMGAEGIRRALLGSIRYGKPLVLDMMEADVFDMCTDKFNEILPDLMDMVMDKSIMEEDNYSKLIRDSDGPDYQISHFDETRIPMFMFIMVSKNLPPPARLSKKTSIIRIEVPT